MTAKTPPKTLGAESRRIWLQLNRSFEFEFEEMLILKVALEQYDLMTKAREEILSDGFTVEAQQGGVKSNPALRAFHVARCGFLEAWKTLNLNVEPPGSVGRPPDSRTLKWQTRLGVN